MSDINEPNADLLKIDPEIRALQQERAKQLRRFNITRVYAPIVLFAFFILVVTVFLLFLVFSPSSSAQTYLTISGMADAAVILGALPVVIISGILLIFIFYGIFSARQRGVAPVRSTLFLFLRLESTLARIDVIISQAADSITKPFIKLRSFYSYIRSLLGQVGAIFKRS